MPESMPPDVRESAPDRIRTCDLGSAGTGPVCCLLLPWPMREGLYQWFDRRTRLIVSPAAMCPPPQPGTALPRGSRLGGEGGLGRNHAILLQAADLSIAEAEHLREHLVGVLAE
jgi:hypothetical protein